MDPAWLLDWIAIWQSEAAALCVDRELQEAAQRQVDGLADHARMAVAAWASHDATGLAGAAASAGPSAAAAAPDGRDALIAELRQRIAELERRLAPP